ncbi:hypothetical protein KP509_33G008200 [Ceratopteris richardii]|uniref:Uncharacterized protein n=1 Tax=Ceratopteris richardii TaxID=49495 RepID=A0A8T2QNE9_CERRI|nr:hypothetical protein KP509_33G008200 [Ceratopteris richardii]
MKYSTAQEITATHIQEQNEGQIYEIWKSPLLTKDLQHYATWVGWIIRNGDTNVVYGNKCNTCYHFGCHYYPEH